MLTNGYSGNSSLTFGGKWSIKVESKAGLEKLQAVIKENAENAEMVVVEYPVSRRYESLYGKNSRNSRLPTQWLLCVVTGKDAESAPALQAAAKWYNRLEAGRRMEIHKIKAKLEESAFYDQFEMLQKDLFFWMEKRKRLDEKLVVFNREARIRFLEQQVDNVIGKMLQFDYPNGFNQFDRLQEQVIRLQRKLARLHKKRLVLNRASKLQALAQEIQELFNEKINTYPAPFALPPELGEFAKKPVLRSGQPFVLAGVAGREFDFQNGLYR